MIVRPAVPGDAPAIAALVQAGFETFRAFAPPDWRAPDQRAHVERDRHEVVEPGVLCLVAEHGGVLAGTVRLVPLPDGPVDFHLRHLFVAQAHWGSGLARELHDAMRSRLTGTARLFTPAGQARARRFYEREGWVLQPDAPDARGIGIPLVEYRLTSQSR